MEANTIDMIPAGISEVYHASQGDSGRTIRCDLVNGSAAVTDEGGNTIENNAQVASGSTINLSVVSVDNKRPSFFNS